ncbi:MAG: hypothetical protein FWD05_04065 [Oscillospiraceae bacterium]|nr:hypothetical protein [Oscillospiraceae bacterium]
MKSISNNERIPLWARGRTEKVVQPRKGELGQFFFFAAFLIFGIRFFIDSSQLFPVRPELLNSILVVVSISCAVAKIAMQNYTLRRLIFTIIVSVILGYSALISTNFIFLQSFLLIIAMQDIELKSVVRFGFWFKLICVSIHVIVYIIVYNTNPEVITFAYRGGVGDSRHQFFMGHTNTFMALLIWTCLEFVYLKYKKINVLHFAAIWIIFLIFFNFTRTFTALFLLIAASILVAFDKLGKEFYSKILTFLAKYLYIFLAVVFILMVVLYTQLSGTILTMWHNLDDFFTGRLWFGAFTYYNFGPTLFGRPDMSPRNVFWAGRYFETMTIFDNYYLGNFLSYGIINAIATIVAIFILVGKMDNRDKIMIILFALFGIMGSEVTNIAVCFVLLIIGKYLYRNGKNAVNKAILDVRQ